MFIGSSFLGGVRGFRVSKAWGVFRGLGFLGFLGVFGVLGF